ncbi:MAG: hypothetical protein ACJ75H_11430 [Thermoanaerobaculia bacterium]
MKEDLLARDFRANPLYELVLWDRLEPGERQALAGLRGDPGFYGVLRPAGDRGLGARSVDRDTALLFLTLREPGPLPAYVRSMLGAEAAVTVARLVADGVLEVERDGAFVSGPAALETDGGPEGDGRLARLSVEALRYGQALAAMAVDDARLLSWRLYGYNQRPLTPAWKRRWPSPEAVERDLGIASGLDRRWVSSGRAGWLSWQARNQEPRAAGGPTWKLYVSPVPEALAESFGEIVEALARGRASQFKIGSDAAGLLRPDKIVAYFPSFERLSQAAAVVTERLAGVPAQGVPFTSEISGDGLLSWGLDPPGAESWRLWLTHRLARALLSARSAAGEPWRLALERVRLEGVDTATWTPGARVGRED